MLIISFNSGSIIRQEFMQEGSTSDVQHYLGVMEWLVKQIQQVQPQIWSVRDFSFRISNAVFVKKKSCCCTIHPTWICPDQIILCF